MKNQQRLTGLSEGRKGLEEGKEVREEWRKWEEPKR